MGLPQRRLVVLARWPAAGRCKRRLAADLGSSQRAAALQGLLTQHTLRAAALASQACGAELVLAADGLGPRGLRRWGQRLMQAEPGIRLLLRPQGGGGLGCRMQRQLRQGFARGREQLVLIGSDLPGLEARDLEQAFQALERQPLVLGPATDGGYWLIGLNRAGFRRAGAGLMAGIAWGSDQVLTQTLRRAEALQLPPALLREQSDLDRRTALEPWLRRRQRRDDRRATHSPG